MSSSPFGLARVIARPTLLLVLIVSAACGRPDSNVQRAIGLALAKDPVTANLNLSVEVSRGVVSLTGQTRTAAEQTRAIEIAQSIEGVKEVKNGMSVADAVLVERVRQALAADLVLASVSIDVDSQGGYVRLMSDQTDRAQRERAVEIAKKVDGVRGVEDRMK